MQPESGRSRWSVWPQRRTRWCAPGTRSGGGFRAGSATIDEPSAALLSGFLIGDTSRMADADIEALRGAGLSHFVAVSGSNVALFLALWWVVAAPLSLGRRTRVVAGLVGLALFVTVTRWEPSVLRATGMAAVMLVGRAAGSGHQWVDGSGHGCLRCASRLTRSGNRTRLSAIGGGDVGDPCRLRHVLRYPAPLGRRRPGGHRRRPTGGDTDPARCGWPGSVGQPGDQPDRGAPRRRGHGDRGRRCLHRDRAAPPTGDGGSTTRFSRWRTRPRVMPQLDVAGVVGRRLSRAVRHPSQLGDRLVALAAATALAVAIGLPASGPDPPAAVFLDVGQGDAIILLGDDGGVVLVDGGPDAGAVLGRSRRARHKAD